MAVDPITVIVDDIELDLFPGTEDNFYVTEQIHDLISLQNRNASFARALDVPFTEKNQRALNGSIPVLNGQEQFVIKLPAQILFKGVPFVSNAQAAGSNRKEDALTITFFYENFDFFEKIRGQLLSELQWSDLDFSFDGAGYLTNSTKTSDVVCALTQFFDSDNLTEEVQSASTTRQEVDLNFSGFHIYLKTIARRIVEQHGFTFDESKMTDVTDYDTLVLSCPVKKFSDLRDIASPLFGLVSKTANQVISGGAGGIESRITFDITAGDPAAVWNVGASEWQFTTTTNVNITLSVDGTNVQGGGNQENQIRIFKNTTQIFVQRITNQATFDLDLIVGTSVVSGDTVHATVFIQRNADVTINAASDFIASEEGANFQRDIIIANWIPAITQSKFLQSLANYFNAVIDTDEATNTVSLIPYKDIIAGDEQDLTDNLDISTRPEEIYTLPYFKRNFFKYADSDSERTDSIGTHIFPDELLDDSGVLVELVFNDADNSDFVSSIFTNKTVPVLENPAFNVEQILDDPTAVGTITTGATNTFTFSQATNFEVGDYIEITSAPLTPAGNREVGRVSQKTSNTTGTVFNNWGNVGAGKNFLVYRFRSVQIATPPINMSPPRIGNIIASQGTYTVFFDGNFAVTSIPAGFEVRFTDSMLFSNLLTDHYDTLLTALNTPFTLLARFHFTPVEFREISLSKRVYLSNFNTHFVINKIEQYKVNGFCRMSLTRV